jgi:hypothetical protein
VSGIDVDSRQQQQQSQVTVPQNAVYGRTLLGLIET